MQLKNSQYSAWGHAKHLVCSNESNEAFKVARSVGGTLEPGLTSGVQLFHRWAAQAQANPKYDNALVFICDTPLALKRGGFFGRSRMSGARSARGVATTPVRP